MSTSNREQVKMANEAWEALMTAHSHLMRDFAAESMWEQVTIGEYDVLYTLAKGKSAMRIGQIQCGVLLSQPALSRMLDRLERRGLVSREPDPDDGRAVLISLTKLGKETQRTAGRAHAQSVTREMRAGLSIEEMGQLHSLCTKLVQRSNQSKGKNNE